MAHAYDILRKMDNGETLPIASRRNLDEAKELAESLNAYWPAEYIVRESKSGVEFQVKQERPADRPQGVFHKPEYLM
jgi:hypothetical protein